jgi:hypothetical protein
LVLDGGDFKDTQKMRMKSKLRDLIRDNFKYIFNNKLVLENEYLNFLKYDERK